MKAITSTGNGLKTYLHGVKFSRLSLYLKKMSTKEKRLCSREREWYVKSLT